MSIVPAEKLRLATVLEKHIEKAVLLLIGERPERVILENLCQHRLLLIVLGGEGVHFFSDFGKLTNVRVHGRTVANDHEKATTFSQNL